jgi:hypothetical protein
LIVVVGFGTFWSFAALLLLGAESESLLLYKFVKDGFWTIKSIECFLRLHYKLLLNFAHTWPSSGKIWWQPREIKKNKTIWGCWKNEHLLFCSAAGANFMFAFYFLLLDGVPT